MPLRPSLEWRHRGRYDDRAGEGTVCHQGDDDFLRAWGISTSKNKFAPLHCCKTGDDLVQHGARASPSAYRPWE